MIQTVLGPISRSQVHNTLAHEHMVFGKPGFSLDTHNPYQRDAAFRHGVERLEMVKPFQVDLVADPTTIEWGRDPLLLRRLSRATGVALVCCTGYFKDEGDMLAHLKARSYCEDLEATLAQEFEKELVQGIGNTGVRAGFLKVASSLGEIRPLEKTIFSAAIRAARQCDAAIFTHCERGTMATRQAELFLSLGMDPRRVIIGHMTSNRDLDEIRAVADLGFRIGFDQFGILSIPGIPDDEEKCRNLLTLLRQGYGDRIVLSQDTICDRMGYVSKSTPRYPDQIYREVLPFLRRESISEETLRRMTRDTLLDVLDGHSGQTL